MTKNITYIFPNNQELSRDESWLYLLLSDHPFFINQITKIRTKINIPKEGLKDGSEIHKWTHEKENNNFILFKESEKLLHKFNIYKDFFYNAKFFVADYILNRDLIKDSLPKYSKETGKLMSGGARRKKPGAKIITAYRNRDINKYIFKPNNTYIEVYPWTTYQDMRAVQKEITKKKNLRKRSQISKQNITARESWALNQQGKTDKEIMRIINKKYKSKVIGYSEVALYRKRYKNALEKIKKL